jgi:hypothetical protein
MVESSTEYDVLKIDKFLPKNLAELELIFLSKIQE